MSCCEECTCGGRRPEVGDAVRSKNTGLNYLVKRVQPGTSGFHTRYIVASVRDGSTTQTVLYEDEFVMLGTTE